MSALAMQNRPARKSGSEREEFFNAVWERVAADHGDDELREAVAVQCEELDGTIAASLVRVIGVRGIISAAIFAAEGNGYDYFGLTHMEAYVLGKWEKADNLAQVACDLIQCPSCYVFETHHSYREYIRPFPCDPVQYAAKVAHEAAEVRARYALGSRIDGYHAYAKHGDFIVTRSEISLKKPSWCKISQSTRWDIDFDTHPGFDSVTIPQTRREEYRGDPAPAIYFSFRRADRVEAQRVTAPVVGEQMAMVFG